MSDGRRRRWRRGDVDGGWAWMVLLASFFNLLVASGVGFVSGIFQKLFLDHFDHSVAFTAWVTALFSSFMQLAGPLSGILTSATNCRVTVMVGGALLTGGLAASAFATSLHYLLVSFGFVAGIGLGLMYSPSIVIVNFFFDRRRTVIMGVALSASGIGITFSPVLSRFLIDHLSWRETMMILAAITAHVCVFGAIMFPMHEPPSPCLRLCRRAPQSGDLDPHPCEDRDLPADQRSCSNPGQFVPTSQCSSSKTSACGDKLHPESTTKEDLSHVQRTELEGLADEPNPNTDDSAEKSLLLKNTNKAEFLCTPNPKHKPCHEHILESTQHKPTLHDFPGRQSQHPFSSGKSLNTLAAHELDGAESSPQHPRRHLSHSAHDLHKTPQCVHHHSPDHHSLAGSVMMMMSGRSTPRGSRVDLQKIAIFSSVHSLHGGTRLPMVTADLLTSSPDLEKEEEGGGGVGGGWRVVKNVWFLILCVNLVLSNMACAIFNIHLPAFCQQRGLSDQDITLVLAMDGVAVFVSRILVGALGHDDRVDNLVVYFGLHLIASLVQASLPWTQHLAGVTALTILMGTYYGSVYSLLTTLTISVVGLPSLAFAFGLEMIAAGLGYLVAPPLAGWVVDETGDYDYSMYLGGLLMFLSALCLLGLTCGRPPGAPPIGYHHPPPPAAETRVKTPLDQQDIDAT